MPTGRSATTCRTSPRCSITMPSASSATCPPTWPAPSPRGWTASCSGSGKVPTRPRTPPWCSSRPFTRGCSRKSGCWTFCKTSSSFRGTVRSRPRYWRAITSISRCARRWSGPGRPPAPTARAACSGIPRAVASRCPWCSTPICCRPRWTAPPSW